MKTIIILTLSILLFSYTIYAEERQEVTAAPGKDVEIKFLKEQINGNEEKTDLQLKTLDEKINALKDESKRIDSDIKLIEERVKNYKEISDRTMISYRNFGILIITLLTFIGAGSIYAIIRNIAKEMAEKQATIAAKEKLKELINEKEILKQVETESTKVIQYLGEEVEKKAKHIGETSKNYLDILLSELETKSKEKLTMLG